MRQAIAVDVDDGSVSLLSPLLSKFSLSGIPSIGSLKNLIPTSPPPTDQIPAPAQHGSAIWQQLDLGDGRGSSPALLVTSRQTLQIWQTRLGDLPDDPHVKEVIPVPEEIFSLSSIQYDSRTKHSSLLARPSRALVEDEVILEARLLPVRLGLSGGPEIAILTSAREGAAREKMSVIAVVVVELRTGMAIKRVEVALASTASLAVSPLAVVVAVDKPTPSLHILNSGDLSFRTSLIDLPPSPVTALPMFDLSGRLVGVACNESPQLPGPDGLGSLVTASTSIRSRPNLRRASQTNVTGPGNDMQRDYISSAIDIGGGVARGVWAGIRAGARAANHARNTRLARSAPTDGSGSLNESARGDDEYGNDSEPRSLDDSSYFEDRTPSASAGGGEWVKIIDLCPRSAPARTNNLAESSIDTARPAFELVAHFRLPARAPVPGVLANDERQTFRPGSSYSSVIAFSPCGTRLIAAQADGRSAHIFAIRPAGTKRSVMRGLCKGQVWHLYELRRGTTAATVRTISWSADGRWVGVATGRGTTHVFAVNPDGGSASAVSHVPIQYSNPAKIPSLSTVVTPSARLRPPRPTDQSDESLPSGRASVCVSVAAFFAQRRDPLRPEMGLLDVALFRRESSQIELARLSISTAQSPVSGRSGQEPFSRRPSALTEMMRNRYTANGDLNVEHTVKGRWLLPQSDDPMVSMAKPRTTYSVRDRKPRILSQAEIQTHTVNPSVLPSSIYLSRQFFFYAARQIDDFSPLSILDLEARQRRLVFRPEAEVRPTSPEGEGRSFDEPLITALHSVIESRPEAQLPALPNGSPAKSAWRNIPIRQVARGVGEGVHRVRQEYARQQYRSSKRKVAQVRRTEGLSFEEDAVFPSSPGDEDEDGRQSEADLEDGSPPSSDILPATNTESSVDEEWAERWEEEYRRAVEDDGGPDDLVLGLMDEEEEQRRRWQERQKGLAREYGK